MVGICIKMGKDMTSIDIQINLGKYQFQDINPKNLEREQNNPF